MIEVNDYPWPLRGIPEYSTVVQKLYDTVCKNKQKCAKLILIKIKQLIEVNDDPWPLRGISEYSTDVLKLHNTDIKTNKNAQNEFNFNKTK